MRSRHGDKVSLTVRKSSLRLASIEVLFHILVPERLADTCTSLMQALVDSGRTIVIELSSASYVGDTATLDAPTVAPAMVDCVGAWVGVGNCSELCGPNGILNTTYTITREAQGGGANCPNSNGDTSTETCNTNTQCPIDCDGAWTEWSNCSVPCGGGSSIRTYVVMSEAQHGGTCELQNVMETVECNTFTCLPPPPPPCPDLATRLAGTMETVDGISVQDTVPVSVGATLWHDRTYTITAVPDFMLEGHFIEQPHKNVPRGSVISIVLRRACTIYMAVESGGRDGGFPTSLTAAGWVRQGGELAVAGTNPLDEIFSFDVDFAQTITLPATTTHQTVASIVIVMTCEQWFGLLPCIGGRNARGSHFWNISLKPSVCSQNGASGVLAAARAHQLAK